jgi:hypothetical protein
MAEAILRLVLVGGMLFLGSWVLAEDLPRAEPIAPPQSVFVRPPIDPGLVVISPPLSRYSVWQNYGVDRAGKFRPLVIGPPYGAFYRFNGAPYPWVTTHPLEVMPYLVD